MEFLRFGSSIPGEYWGCCAADIIQNFNQHPDTKASIQLVDGDGGSAITHKNELAFAGPTLRDIFETRIRIGTFGSREMPNHAFFAILNGSQCNSAIGKAWLAILKQHGFEYLRTVNNSVWNVNNHIFALIRNVGPNAVKDLFTPPAAWTALNSVVPEPWSMLGDLKQLTTDISKAQTAAWNSGAPVSIKTESEIEKAKAPVVMAALRTEFPPQLKTKREEALKARKEAGKPVQPSAGTQYIY